MTRSIAKNPSLGGPEAWFIWSIAVAFVIFLFSFQTGYSIAVPGLQKEIGLSAAEVGFVAAAYTWMFAACQFMSGALLDRLGARKVLPPCILLVTIGVFLFANASNFAVLLLSKTFIAVGACTGFVGAGYIGGKWFGMAKFSVMFGLVQFAASLFAAINENLLNWALAILSWRELFDGMGIFGICLLIVAALYLRDPVPVIVPAGQSFAKVFESIFKSLFEVGRVPHTWFASAFGALCFGAMLSLGVVWGPKLLVARGLDVSTANAGASFLWLGLAAGGFVVPRVSDLLRRRKLPTIAGIIVQIGALSILLYSQPLGAPLDMVVCFLFGLGNAVHMLAFSTAADVVEPEHVGTSAAIVNGVMFIMGGILISSPGVRIGVGLQRGIQPSSLGLAQFAGWPLLLALCLALVIAALMRETYPREVAIPRDVVMTAG
jgi:MFS family permease